MLRSIAKSNNVSTLNFWINLYTYAQSNCTSLLSHMKKCCPFSTSSPAFIIDCFLGISLAIYLAICIYISIIFILLSCTPSWPNFPLPKLPHFPPRNIKNNWILTAYPVKNRLGTKPHIKFRRRKPNWKNKIQRSREKWGNIESQSYFSLHFPNCSESSTLVGQFLNHFSFFF